MFTIYDLAQDLTLMKGAFDRWNSTSYVHCNSTDAGPKTPTAPYELLKLNGNSGLRWGGSVDGMYMFKARVIDSKFR